MSGETEKTSYSKIETKALGEGKTDNESKQNVKAEFMLPEKTFGERVVSAFQSVKPKNVFEGFFIDVLFPGILNSTEDFISRIFQNLMVAMGCRQRRGYSESDRRYGIDYSERSDRQSRRKYDDRRDGGYQYDNRDYRHIKMLLRCQTRETAEQFIQDLINDNASNPYISVKDLFQQANMDAPYTSSYWGWKDLDYTDVRYTWKTDMDEKKEGWLLIMPPAEEFKRKE